MSDDSSNSGAAAKRPAARLTLEEKLWFDRRKSELEQYSAFGAGIGAVVSAGVTCTSWHFHGSCVARSRAAKASARI